MSGSYRPLVHVVAIAALAAVGLALGRWLRDPQAGGPLLFLALLSGLAGLALRRLYRPGGIGWREKPGTEPFFSSDEKKGPVPEFSSLWADDRVDLNSATREELMELPGIGPVAAGRILEDRAANGPFASVGDLARVPGFGPAKVRALEDRVSATDRA